MHSMRLHGVEISETMEGGIAMLERKTVSQCITADYCWGWNDAVDAMPKWISTKDRLPQHGGLFIIATRYGEIRTAYYHPKTYAFESDPAGVDSKHITHWLPLPGIPEEG